MLQSVPLLALLLLRDHLVRTNVRPLSLIVTISSWLIGDDILPHVPHHSSSPLGIDRVDTRYHSTTTHPWPGPVSSNPVTALTSSYIARRKKENVRYPRAELNLLLHTTVTHYLHVRCTSFGTCDASSSICRCVWFATHRYVYLVSIY